MGSKGLSFRIQTAREKRQLSKSQLAKEVGVTRSAIGQWENGAVGDLKCRYFFPLAKALDINPEELFFGTPTTGSELTPTQVWFVPLLEWDNLGETMPITTMQYIPTTLALEPEEGFALRVRSDIMQGAGSPFAPEATVIFDRKRNWESGDFVIADTGDGFVFRQIMADGNQIFLKPINPQYPTITCQEPITVIGVAVETLTTI